MSEVSATSNSTAGDVGPIPEEPIVSQIVSTAQIVGQGELQRPNPQPPQTIQPEVQQPFLTQFEMASSPAHGRHGPYNMNSMTGALPMGSYQPGQYHQGAQQRYNPSSPPPMPPLMQHAARYNSQPPMTITPQGYYIHQPQAMPYYGANQPPPSHVSSGVPPRQNIPYYPSPMMMNHPQAALYYHQSVQYPAPNQLNVADTYAPRQHNSRDSNPSTLSKSSVTKDSSALSKTNMEQQKEIPDEIERHKGSVRGPPRKPRQNGHAVWVGNLPPQTDLMKLVHHVSKEASGLESLFLISKSNCAFANFKDEESCATAQQKLHESKFQAVRLVSRLRKNNIDSPAGMISLSNPATALRSSTEGSLESQEVSRTETQKLSSSIISRQSISESGQATSRKDKFFILKSLTVYDLELSIRTGTWATQSHNEEALNNAFKTCDNVYLVFSANKSGGYFGYARMTSETDQNPEAAIKFTPANQRTSDLELPKAILTEATEYISKGRIIDDSARGTIFWEIEREEEEESDSDNESDTVSNKTSGLTTGEEEKTWGKPFKLEWLSTTRLPFYRTRGLRNPWNSNREVKIARDGTELEPSVGHKLIALFSRVQSPRLPTAAQPSRGMPQFQQIHPY